ncbi:hypothetical protein BU16DRAFT_145477 [Lophium mytilinum]|uniref:Uncharacterized protein n=1 Tax=Lophium mytilinum TaxID=390894 RepID=A0A6A6QFQ3_9PEZI|nr:hypothetical protein BU16DRAFT_145477 [Lophium mytilinum]
MPSHQRPELQPRPASVATVSILSGGPTERFEMYPGRIHFWGPHDAFLFQCPRLQLPTDPSIDVDFPRDATVYIEPSDIELSEDVVSVMHDEGTSHRIAMSKARGEMDQSPECVLQALPKRQYRIFSRDFPSVLIEWNNVMVEIEAEGEVCLRRWTIFPKPEKTGQSKIKENATT